ncbi:hypothetical protein CDAR_591061 [Caerostris darwini]|uniref:Uncharacterized protein n=1 Tax=Caerostris darwini TaxID=1538125 RepID=A0AAV4RPK9_9ARAC|nr:hypothetical protein CDAR_591061 [Caerostris darwini]
MKPNIKWFPKFLVIRRKNNIFYVKNITVFSSYTGSIAKYFYQHRKEKSLCFICSSIRELEDIFFPSPTRKHIRDPMNAIRRIDKPIYRSNRRLPIVCDAISEGGEDILVTHRDRRLHRNDTAGVGKHAGEPRREETQFPTLRGRGHQNVIVEFGPF